MKEQAAIRFLFQGDSITDRGRQYDRPDDLGLGYPKYVAELWKKEGATEADLSRPVAFMNRGVSGDRTKDILARFRQDVADLEPDIVSLLVGINNVWRAFDANDPTPLSRFREEYETILRQMTELPKKPKIIILEPFVLRSRPDYERFREDLDPKIDVIRELAFTYADLYVPLDGLLQARAMNGPGSEALSEDGVHLTDEGSETVADFILHYMLHEQDGSFFA